jgi:hypothetical protein
MNKTHNTVDLSMIFTDMIPFLFKRTFFIFILIVICSGLTRAQQVIRTDKSISIKEVVVLPISYKIDSTYQDKGEVSNDRVSRSEQAGFKQQLEKLAVDAAKEGGNILQLKRIDDPKQSGRYRFLGEAYHTNDIIKLKEKIADRNKKKFGDGQCAYLTIYRPSYSLGFNDDSIRSEVTINDTFKFILKANTRYILKVAKESSVTMRVQHSDFIQNISVDMKMGNSYYVRNYINIPGYGKFITTGGVQLHLRGYTPYLEKVDEQQGEIESSMITQVVISKKL